MQELKMEKREIKAKQEIKVEKKQKLRALLDETELVQFQQGNIVVVSAGGQKIGLEDEIKGTILILTPMQGG